MGNGQAETRIRAMAACAQETFPVVKFILSKVLFGSDKMSFMMV